MASSSSSPVGKSPRRWPCISINFSAAIHELENLFTTSSSSIELSRQQVLKAKRQLCFLKIEHNQLLERIGELETALGLPPQGTKKAKRTAVTRAASPFTTLPDLCLLALFQQLPHFEQLKALQVCTRWSQLVPLVNRTRTSLTLHLGLGSNASLLDKDYWFWLPTDRRSVTHLVDESGRKQFPSWKETKWNTLSLTALSSITVDRISTVFSNISDLTIRLDNTTSTASTIDNLLLLLKRHQTKLLNLNLTEHYPNSTPVTIKQIYATLNSLSTLKRLTLSFNHWPLKELPILGQLEQFNLRYKCTQQSRRSSHIEFLQMLSKYGESNDSLTVGYFNGSGLPPHQSFPGPFTSQLSRNLRDRFTWLKLSMINDPALLSAHFRNLTCLDVYWDIRHRNAGQRFSYLLLQLTHLPKLFYLNLSTALQLLKIPDSDRPLPQLPSIRAFDLRPFGVQPEETSMSSHQQLHQLNLSWTMPNLEVFSFDFGYSLTNSRSSCTDCGVNFDIAWLQGERGRVEKAKRCARHLFGPLKSQCRRLRVMLHDREAILGSAEKLLIEAEYTKKIIELIKLKMENKQ